MAVFQLMSLERYIILQQTLTVIVAVLMWKMTIILFEIVRVLCLFGYLFVHLSQVFSTSMIVNLGQSRMLLLL